MNYERIYNEIIERAQTENRKKKQGTYYEKHHIIPTCMNGTNKKDNLVLLTGKEHFICHRLLYRIYPNESSLQTALWLMSTTKGRGYNVSARLYERMKQMHANLSSKRNKGQIPWSKGMKLGPHKHNGLTYTEIYGKDQASIIKSKQSKIRLGKPLSDETKQRMSESAKGKVKSQLHRDNLSKSHKGKTFSDEHQTNMKLASLNYWKNAPSIICPHCNKEGKSKYNMTKYHFDNCKHEIK